MSLFCADSIAVDKENIYVGFDPVMDYELFGYPGNYGVILKSENMGKTWKVIYKGQFEYIFSIVSDKEANLYIALREWKFKNDHLIQENISRFWGQKIGVKHGKKCILVYPILL